MRVTIFQVILISRSEIQTVQSPLRQWHSDLESSSLAAYWEGGKGKGLLFFPVSSGSVNV